MAQYPTNGGFKFEEFKMSVRVKISAEKIQAEINKGSRSFVYNDKYDIEVDVLRTVKNLLTIKVFIKGTDYKGNMTRRLYLMDTMYAKDLVGSVSFPYGCFLDAVFNSRLMDADGVYEYIERNQN